MIIMLDKTIDGNKNMSAYTDLGLGITIFVTLIMFWKKNNKNVYNFRQNL